MSRIAVIGWGSLIWDLDDLAPKVRGAWMIGAGPRLPLEFSRVSPKRRMGLTVCIDHGHGAACPSHVIRSTRRDVLDAAEDLAARERTPLENIGHATRDGGESRLPGILSTMHDWLAASGFDGAVWTDLPPHFEPVTGQPFSVPNARTYLRGLEGDSLEEAHRYIEEAPAATVTPLRRALQADPWWQSLGPSLRRRA